MKKYIPVIVCLVFVVISSAESSQQSKIFINFMVYNNESSKVISHSIFSEFLKKNTKIVNGDSNLIKYKYVTREDKKNLLKYLIYLQNIQISNYNRREQLSFWLNLYNASIIRLVLENYPISSPKEIGRVFFFGGPWKKKRIKVEDVKLSLDDIEHKIVRPIWKNKLVHYGFNCAAMGCPGIDNNAFTAKTVFKKLNINAKKFINSKRGVKINDGLIYVSKIYLWYSEDFGNNDRDILQHLLHYSDKKLKISLIKKQKISGYFYDWNLNGASE